MRHKLSSCWSIRSVVAVYVTMKMLTRLSLRRVDLLLPVIFLAALQMLADGFILVPEAGPIRPTPPPSERPWHGPPPRSFAPLEVVFHHVQAKVRDQVAVTIVDQEFFNPNDRQLEGTYIFPIPQGAQIDKFSMDVNGRQVDAELLTADKARQIYEDIVRKHRDPALLEYVGRGVFKARIFPIEPRSKKRVKLVYTQVLPADAGLVSYLYPLNTEKFSAKPIQNISLKLEIETTRPLLSIYSPSHAVEIRRQGSHRATIGFEAKDVKPDTDFQVFYAPSGGDIGMSLLTCKPGGEDGYFLLLASPAYESKTDKAQPKDVTFVLDTSGSMAGRKLEQAKKALAFCVANLNDGDRFEIIRFATDTEALFDRLVEAGKANRDRALKFIEDLKPTGGTAIHDALQRALAKSPDKSTRPALVVFLTDGLPTVGETANDRIVDVVKHRAGGTTRVFCFGIGTDVNTHLLDRITEATHAASAYVLPEEDLEVKVSSFFAKVKDPVLADVKLILPDAIRPAALYPSPLPDLFRGEQLVVVGRYAGHGAGKLILEGTVGGNRRTFEFPGTFSEKLGENDFIPRLWATRRVGYLLDEIRLRGENAELRDEVIELARKYAIVTPYTAFLIHEDEVHRGVPLAAQTMSLFSTNTVARHRGEEAYRALRSDVSGSSAVSAARYGLAQKSANQVSTALSDGIVEANRAFDLAATPVSAPSTPAAGVASSLSSTATPADRAKAVSGIAQLSHQSRFVGGRTFFQNGDQWIDARVGQQTGAARVRIQFGSAAYFDLLAKGADVRAWLSLGQNIQFVDADSIYEVHE